MDLEIEVSKGLLERLTEVASQLHPGSQDGAVDRVVEQALAMRLFYAQIGGPAALAVEEPVGHWELPGDTDYPEADVARWLFGDK